MKTCIGCLISVAAWSGTQQPGEIVQESTSTLEKIHVCALQADPALYDREVIEVTGIFW
jgi:hypothetical protein